MANELTLRNNWLTKSFNGGGGVAKAGITDLDAEINRLMPGFIRQKPPTLIYLAFCSIDRIGFLVESERHDHLLSAYNVRTDIPPDMRGVAELEHMGHFSFEWSRYPGCPHCGAGMRDGTPFWWSSHCRCSPAFHCNGTMFSGQRTCKCGTIHGSKTVRHATAAVTGLLPTIGTL